MHISPQNRASEYRRRAQEARALAGQISISDDRHRLLETARHLEQLAAEEEARGAKQADDRSLPEPPA